MKKINKKNQAILPGHQWLVCKYENIFLNMLSQILIQFCKQFIDERML